MNVKSAEGFAFPTCVPPGLFPEQQNWTLNSASLVDTRVHDRIHKSQPATFGFSLHTTKSNFLVFRFDTKRPCAPKTGVAAAQQCRRVADPFFPRECVCVCCDTVERLSLAFWARCSELSPSPIDSLPYNGDETSFKRDHCDV